MSNPVIYHDKSEIAKILLLVGAVTLSPHQLYTWASGIKSPIYCDNRLVLSSPVARTAVLNALQDFVASELPAIEGVAGTATAGIPNAALLADRLGLPLVYVRSSAKGHGKQNLVEGRVLTGQRLLVVEDTISTGGSSLNAVEALREMGAIVPHVVGVFTYGFPKTEVAFAAADVKLYALTDYATLIAEAQAIHLIRAAEADVLKKFYKDPWAFGM